MEDPSTLLTDLLDIACLECPVCLELLDASAKVLPCQHTFCRRCLDEIVHSRNELLCPECRIVVDKKVDDLPANILLIRLLEGIKNNAKKEKSAGSGYLADLLSTVPKAATRANMQHLLQSQQQPLPQPQRPDPALQQPTQNSSLSLPKQADSFPKAKALYNYEGKELDDLSFKKGDIVVLRKRIDPNWYYGELNGKFGCLPTSYVQVINSHSPLPPQCKALYDFRVTDVEEKDCLSFARNDIITVLRRVDDNWSEGKLGDRIGIFPNSFVEMNNSAKVIMKLSPNTTAPSREAPPAPVAFVSENMNTKPILPISSKTEQNSGRPLKSPPTTTPSHSSPTSIINLPVLPISVPSSSNSVSTSPVMSSANATSSTEESRSQDNLSDNTLNKFANQKRHSLCSVSTSTTLNQNFQRSMSQQPAGGSNTQNQQLRHSLETLSVNSDDVQESNFLDNSRAKCESSATSSLNNSSNLIQATPNYSIYVAMYNYKPQKNDELELKKGDLYSVSEKCHDGWYKGIALSSGLCGVFPGNYVQLTKTAQIQSPNLPPTNRPITSKSPPMMASELPVNKPKPPILSKPSTSLPHEVPATSNSPTNSGPSLSYARPRPTPSNANSCATDWNKSINTLVPPPPPQKPRLPVAALATATSSATDNSPQAKLAAAMNQSLKVSPTHSSPQSSPGSQWHQPRVAATRNVPSPSFNSTAVAITPPNISMSSISNTSPTPVPLTKSTNKKERSSFMKRLTSKPKKKSERAQPPPASQFSCDNPTFVDTSFLSVSNSSLQPMHIRSGSCPSQSASGQTQSATQPKTTSFDDTSMLMKNPMNKQPTAPPLVRERFRCIVPYPPNSEYELELQVGDIVYVHKKRDDGWYKGTLQRTGQTGLFPGPFVEIF